MSATIPPDVPNHHAGHPGFSGIGGCLAGLTMVVGRRRVARIAAGAAGLRAGQHLVDVGCGPGAPAREAARLGARVTAVDPSAVMLRLARTMPGGDGIRWQEGAAEHLPLDAESADVVWSIATVHHWPDLDGGLREAHRVLVPRGRFVAVERRIRPDATGLASHGWTHDQAGAFADRCRDAGFTEVSVGTRPGRVSRHLVVAATRPPA